MLPFNQTKIAGWMLRLADWIRPATHPSNMSPDEIADELEKVWARPYACPIFFRDGTQIVFTRIPTNTVADAKTSGLVAGHVASRVRRRTVIQPVQRVGEFVCKL
jgi:hypothetical protein